MQEIVESSRKLSICEQQGQAAVEVARRQNELVLANAQKVGQLLHPIRQDRWCYLVTFLTTIIHSYDF